jgi:2-oxo-4-hydroxy-4-carboxy-5-ureidoimidazoline decarboxylase
VAPVDTADFDTADFDAAPEPEAHGLLSACCASERWIRSMLAARPFGSLERLVAASDTAIGELGWPDIEQALAAHPRIGERRPGTDVEARWSRQEQAGAAAVADATAAALRAGNVAYERRFGHVFLICASGRSAAEMLAALQLRLGNPPDVEREVVRGELGAIVRLRLAKAFR